MNHPLRASLAAGLVIGVHLIVLATILRQGLSPAARGQESRSLIWSLHHDTVYRAGPGADFFAVYHAGVQMSRGESPYDNAEHPRVTPPFYPFRYLPIVGQTIGRAAVGFDPWMAYVAWLIALELLLACLLAALWWNSPGPVPRLALAACLLLSSPYFLELHMGQFTFAACALLVIGLVLLDRSSDGSRAGGTLVLLGAALLKVFPLVVCASVLRARRGLVVVTVIAGFVLATAVPYFWSRPADWTVFAALNLSDGDASGFHTGNFGFLYLLYLGAVQIGPTADGYFRAFATAWPVFALGITATVVFFNRSSVLTGGVTLVLAHMASYHHVWEHHASGAIVVAVFLITRLTGDRGWRAGWMALACVVALTLPTPFAWIDDLDPSAVNTNPNWPPLVEFILPACKGLPVFVLWLLGLGQCVRERDPRCTNDASELKPKGST